VTQSVTRRVVKEPARVEERCTVEDKEEVCQMVTIPAVFDTITERVVVQNAAPELVTIPATFKTVIPEVTEEDIKKANEAFTESFEPID